MIKKRKGIKERKRIGDEKEGVLSKKGEKCFHSKRVKKLFSPKRVKMFSSEKGKSYFYQKRVGDRSGVGGHC